MDNNRPLNEEFYKKLNETNGFLKHMYDNTTFADNYGSSMVIVIIVLSQQTQHMFKLQIH